MEHAESPVPRPAAGPSDERPEARLQFLLDAGTRLDASLDLTTTLQTLARVTVSRLGDLCMIDMLWSDEHAERVALAHVDPAVEELVETVVSRWPSVFDAAHPAIRDAVRSGRTYFNPEVTPADVTAAFTDAAQGAGAVSWQFRSGIIVPLVARGRVLGAISMCLTGPGPPHTERDVALLEDLARRAALAVDNSRMYTELRRADAAQRFLAETSRVLAGSLDWDTTMRAVARQSVAEIADMCSIFVLDDRGRVTNATIEHADPEKLALLLDTWHRYPWLRPDGPLLSSLSNGRSVLLPQLGMAQWREMAVDDEHLRRLRAINLASSVWVPMLSRGRVIGALILGITESGRRFDAADLALAEELGRRAGVAADNARLYSDRSRVARTLQDSLMPPRPPAVPHLDIGVRFRPAGDGTELGGDFYDLFEHRPGEWTAVVGDVCGKGAVAAAVTALARHTVRTAAPYEPGPAGVLHALHRDISEQSPRFVFCTAALVHLEPGPRRCAVRIALGGHPPALVLRADGRVDALVPAGPLLGVLDRIEIPETRTELAAGDALVLYTDGVTEAGAPDEQLGEDGLAATLAEMCGQDADTIAATIIKAVLHIDGDRPRDDIAVLVLRATA